MRVPVDGEAIVTDRLLVGIGELCRRPSTRSSGQVAMELWCANRRSAGCPRFQGCDEADLAVPGVGVERVAGSRGAPGVLLSLQVAPGHEQEVLCALLHGAGAGEHEVGEGIANDADAELILGV